MKLPSFDADGDLPPGIHWTDWQTFTQRYGGTDRRSDLLQGLKNAILALRMANCQTIYVDGSFVTRKETPGDYDACWDPAGVNWDCLTQFYWITAISAKRKKTNIRANYSSLPLWKPKPDCHF